MIASARKTIWGYLNGREGRKKKYQKHASGTKKKRGKYNEEGEKGDGRSALPYSTRGQGGGNGGVTRGS